MLPENTREDKRLYVGFLVFLCFLFLLASEYKVGGEQGTGAHRAWLDWNFFFGRTVQMPDRCRYRAYRDSFCPPFFRQDANPDTNTGIPPVGFAGRASRIRRSDQCDALSFSVSWYCFSHSPD